MCRTLQWSTIAVDGYHDYNLIFWYIKVVIGKEKYLRPQPFGNCESDYDAVLPNDYDWVQTLLGSMIIKIMGLAFPIIGVWMKFRRGSLSQLRWAQHFFVVLWQERCGWFTWSFSKAAWVCPAREDNLCEWLAKRMSYQDLILVL